MAPILTRVGQAFGFGASSGGASGPTPGMEATGGVISDYDDSGQKYRSHTFTNSGAFVIGTLSPDPAKNEVDYLVVGGGGGGGADAYGDPRGAGGGGAGGVIYTEGHTVSATGSWSLSIGEGGSGGGYMAPDTSTCKGKGGGDSVLTLPTGARTAPGGGGGAGHSVPGQSPGPTCSGASGGGGPNGQAGGPGTGQSGHPGGIDIESPPGAFWGNAGAYGGPNPNGYYTGGGGGGAAAAGTAGSNGSHGPGGIGARYTIANGNATYYGGGGGGGGKFNQPGGTGGSGGGGHGSRSAGPAGRNGWPGLGGGGGAIGDYGGDGYGSAYKGGDGTVIIRYKIADGDTDSSMGGTNQATGGLVSYYGSKTIHAFLYDGTFVTGSGFSKTVEYVMIGGGGSGAVGYGGAGGAGGLYVDTVALGANVNLPVTVGDGGKNAYRNSGNTSNQGGRGMQGKSTEVSWPGANKSATGGGWGQSNDVPPNSVGGPGGSGGGGGIGPGGSNSMGNGGPNSGNGTGSAGGVGWQSGDANFNASGGGGGAGDQAGATGPGQGGPGGNGVQLPTTFRDPRCTLGMPGPIPGGGGLWWVCGGGGGGHGDTPYPAPRGGGGPGWNSPPISGTPDGVTIPWSGGGNGSGTNNSPTSPNNGDAIGATNGHANTGGGGGGCGQGGRDGSGVRTRRSGAGGSGLVLVAYPTQDRLKSVTLNPFWMPGGVILCLFVNDYGINRITETTLHRILCMVHALGCPCYHFAF